MIGTIALILVSFVTGIFFPFYLERVVTFFQNRALIKSITPYEVVEEELCKGPHAWMDARALTDKGPGTVKVCRVCGFISGTNKMASSEAIDRMEDNIRYHAIEEKLYSDFIKREDDEIKKFMDKEIQGGVDFDKLAAIHNAGMTFSTRFSYYRSSKEEEVEKELTKSDA